MKNFLIVSLIVLLSGCASATSDKLPVLTVSIEPLRYVVEAVAGDKYQVSTIMPQGGSPETYEPTPRQMVNMAGSIIIFRAGTLGFEQTKLPDLAQANPDIPLVDLGKTIEGIASEDHGHDGEESIDPHTWMSPDNLAIMAENACSALCTADSSNATYYYKRLQTFKKKMDSLDLQIRNILKPVKKRTFLIYHPALGYFAQTYGLKQLAVEHDGKEHSATRLKSLLNLCRTQNVECVFVSKEHSGQAARRLAEELKARVVEINPLAYDVPSQFLLIANSLKNGE